MKRIALLVNPVSGKGKAVESGQWLGDELRKKAITFEKFTDWPSSLEGFTDVWIVGGDGTFNYFLNKYPSSQLPLAIFKGGTGNDFAWRLYGNCNLEEQLAKVLASSPRSVDAGSCNGRLYANSSGIGFDGEVLRSMNFIRGLGGHLGYLWVVIRKIFSFKEHKFKIRAGDINVDERFLLVIVNNSSRTGGGFMVSPAASITDGRLDLVLCRPLSILKRLRYLPVIEKGRHSDLPFIITKQEKSVHIECERELYAQLDGELICSKVFDYEVLPGYLMICY